MLKLEEQIDIERGMSVYRLSVCGQTREGLKLISVDMLKTSHLPTVIEALESLTSTLKGLVE